MIQTNNTYNFFKKNQIVPNDEIDESMDVDGKLEENLLAGKFLVRYFEDMTQYVLKSLRVILCSYKQCYFNAD